MNKYLLALNPETAGQKVLDFACCNSKPADGIMLMEWLRVYYKQLQYAFFHGDPVNNLLKYLITRNDAFVVLGTPNRNSILRLLLSGAIRSGSKKLFNPIFIVHN